MFESVCSVLISFIGLLVLFMFIFMLMLSFIAFNFSNLALAFMDYVFFYAFVFISSLLMFLCLLFDFSFIYLNCLFVISLFFMLFYNFIYYFMDFLSRNSLLLLLSLNSLLFGFCSSSSYFLVNFLNFLFLVIVLLFMFYMFTKKNKSFNGFYGTGSLVFCMEKIYCLYLILLGIFVIVFSLLDLVGLFSHLLINIVEKAIPVSGGGDGLFIGCEVYKGFYVDHYWFVDRRFPEGLFDLDSDIDVNDLHPSFHYVKDWHDSFLDLSEEVLRNSTPKGGVESIKYLHIDVGSENNNPCLCMHLYGKNFVEPITMSPEVLRKHIDMQNNYVHMSLNIPGWDRRSPFSAMYKYPSYKSSGLLSKISNLFKR